MLSLCGTQPAFSLQGTTTMCFLIATFALARGVALPGRARLAANCLAGMALVQVELCCMHYCCGISEGLILFDAKLVVVISNYS